MKKFWLAFAGVVLFAFAAHASSQTPEQFLRAIYDGYTKPSHVTVFEEDNVQTHRLFEADLADEIAADYRKMQDMPGEPVLDFDLFMGSNDDIAIKGPVGITMQSQTADRAICVVTFMNSGKRQALTFSLIKAGATWKIRDIDWNSQRSLRALLSHH